MARQPDFETRALEFHSDRMWSWIWASRALDFMSRHGMNALVFHKNDMIDLLTLPAKYISVDTSWARWPVRYHNIDNNRQYIRHVIRNAHARGIRFYIEVKEIFCHESLLEMNPSLRKKGALCASDPFWWEFLEAKTTELLEAVPDLDGVVVSPATRESKVSISTNACRCPRCRGTEATAWYESLIGAMFRPIDARGKMLAVRDFSYKKGDQSAVLQAADRISSNIVIWLKNTPHDFYPTFPNNARIGDVGAHPQWAEFDMWGQFFGLGVFPSIVVDDMKKRFEHCKANGVTGVVARTDWEVISDGGVLDSLNIVNLLGFAKLSNDLSALPREIIDEGVAGPLKTTMNGSGAEFVLESAAARRALSDILAQSWDVMRRTVFVLDHVFHEDCMFPDTLQKAFRMMLEIHSIAEWDPQRKGVLRLSEDKIAEVEAEKAEACRLARQMHDKVDALRGDMSADTWSQLHRTFDLLVWYTEGFRHCASVCFRTQFALEQDSERHRKDAASAIAAMERYRDELDACLSREMYPYLVYWLLDVARLDSLAQDARRSLAGRPADKAHAH